ncbi:hypothetical protein CDQ84_02090 [Clostridium thermosuccinogenes]|jgi:hypothetical protein|uniref:Uncharacterized protein n=1 Tax=Clostridium thermosuccinogenes TaxID=84032 RepID=A0A2K2F0V0_9CLOT|nr:hypothetical protein [Pseudoclostridium thermosuccinogenes]AUS96914.1 hypothetical protein CDO33_11010 [Pseudoclostridium thermosuccinogenes]PNT92417.1 hypothetical protein CDQ83_02230 [Pseudoclostridium thermosuccinogenes]PNT99669.1 hypothetical protein CDQ85_02245 [Pseudoclostridium thermosuccinogenes]PNU01197.1 hypothetical protein CDQ84_02090 [Pseudoclostridium thermosuccinogenes]
MPDGVYGGAGTFSGGNFAALLSNYIGETVTIFTSSGGQSGSGFTGVILSVNNVFVRLITRIGPPPGCSLGNACTGFNVGYYPSYGGCGDGHGGYGHGGFGSGPIAPASELGATTAGGWNGYPVYTVGSVTDIPIASIVSFVHNAV